VGVPVLFKRYRVSEGKKAYMLAISAKSIEIKRASERAAFYAVQSLCQLLGLIDLKSCRRYIHCIF